MILSNYKKTKLREISLHVSFCPLFTPCCDFLLTMVVKECAGFNFVSLNKLESNLLQPALNLSAIIQRELSPWQKKNKICNKKGGRTWFCHNKNLPAWSFHKARSVLLILPFPPPPLLLALVPPLYYIGDDWIPLLSHWKPFDPPPKISTLPPPPPSVINNALINTD